MAIPPPTPLEGRRYRVIFNDGTRDNKQVVLTFLETVGNDHVFSARPFAGTVKIRVADTISMIETQRPLAPRPTKVRN